MPVMNTLSLSLTKAYKQIQIVITEKRRRKNTAWNIRTRVNWKAERKPSKKNIEKKKIVKA